LFPDCLIAIALDPADEGVVVWCVLEY
jgi:hypothetical protein